MEKFRVSRVTGLAGAIAWPHLDNTAPPPSKPATPTQTPTRATCAGTAPSCANGGRVWKAAASQSDQPFDYIEDYPTATTSPPPWNPRTTDRQLRTAHALLRLPALYRHEYLLHCLSDHSELYLSPNTDPGSKSALPG